MAGAVPQCPVCCRPMQARQTVLECPELCAQIQHSPEGRAPAARTVGGSSEPDLLPGPRATLPVFTRIILTAEQLTLLSEVVNRDHAAGRSGHNARSKQIVAWYAGRSAEEPLTSVVLFQTQSSRKLFADWQSERPLYNRIIEWLAS